MSAELQTKLLAEYIMSEIEGEPSQNEGAGDCAVRLLKKYRAAFTKIMNELGVPGAGHPAPVANAYEIAKEVLKTHQFENAPPSWKTMEAHQRGD